MFVKARSILIVLRIVLVMLVVIVSACVPAAGPSADLSVELLLPDDGDIRASSLPFGRTAIHVLVAREGTILPRSRGSAERQRLADALSLRARPRDALADSLSFAERRTILDGTERGIALEGFLPGASYLVTVVVFNADDLDEQPYIAPGRIELESGRNGIRLDLRRNHAAMLNFFTGNYSIDPWSQEFAGLQLAVMDTFNDRALLLTGFRPDGSGWNEIEPSGDDFPNLDLEPRHIALADRGRLLLYGERFDDSAGTGFLLTNAEGRIIDWFGTSPVDMSLYNPIKVDRVRGLAYFVDPQTSAVVQLDLATGDTVDFSSAGLPQPLAFAVNSNGNLFIYTDSEPNPRIVRYNPIRDIEPDVVPVDPELDLETMFLPTDMTFVGSTLYLFDYTAGEGNVVVGLDSSFNIRGSFGSMFSDIQNLEDREFLGPIRFLDSNSPNVYIADGSPDVDGNGQEASRIVRFRGATGLDWFTYGEFGSGVGEFKFVDDSVGQPL